MIDPVAVEGLPRTAAAAAVVAHARASGLTFSHFEHCVFLEADAWRVDRADLGAVEGWRAGVLPETKFRHFRLDRMVASFHPAHSPKWTAHELCHRLVGWAWHPGADSWFLANAARLAELLPVALWYFYDEPGRRCARHTWADPRFDQRCRACEALVAELGPAERSDEAVAAGDRFVADELAALHAGLRDGVPRPHRYATLELCSDGFSWAAAHGPRLRSREFSAWVERFVPQGSGRSASLDELEARVLAVRDAFRDGAALTPWTARWDVQDVAWRMATVQADCDPDTARRIDALLDTLADSGDIPAAVESWRALADDVEVPAAEDVFAVGYDLAGTDVGRSVRQIIDGLETVCPRTLGLLGDVPATVAGFVAQDTAVRAPLGRRFAAWLGGMDAAVGVRGPAPTVSDAPELAALEAAIAHAPPMDAAVAALRDAPDPGGPVCVAPGVELLPVSRTWVPWLTESKRARPRDGWIAVVREPDGQVALWEVDAAANIGPTPTLVSVSPLVRRGLLAAGVWWVVRAAP